VPTKEVCGNSGSSGVVCSLEKGHTGKCCGTSPGAISPSILDGIPIKFPVHFFSSRTEGEILDSPAKATDLKVVSACPRCGAPIYGQVTISLEQFADPALLRYSCDCRSIQRGVPMETK